MDQLATSRVQSPSPLETEGLEEPMFRLPSSEHKSQPNKTQDDRSYEFRLRSPTLASRSVPPTVLEMQDGLTTPHTRPPIPASSAKSSGASARTETNHVVVGGGAFDDHEVAAFARTRFGHRLAGDMEGEDDGAEMDFTPESSANKWTPGTTGGPPNKAIIMSVATSRNRLGVAVFREESNDIECAEAFESPDFDMLRLILAQVQPSCVICHTGTSDRFMAVLKQEPVGEQQRGMPADISTPTSSPLFEIKIQRMVDFSLESARSKFQMVETGTGKTASELLESNATEENTQQIRALCGLVTYLLKNQPSSIDDAQDKLHIARLAGFSFDAVMHLDANTIHSLQIFKTEEHPSALSRGGAKEGLSLFCVLSRWCSSPSGRALLRQWLTRPLLDVTQIEERQDVIGFLIDAESSDPLIELLRSELRALRNVSRVLSRIEQASASLLDWKNLFATTLIARRIVELLYPRTKDIEAPALLVNIIGAFNNEQIFEVAATIDQVLDMKESRRAQRLCVKPGVSSELDELKHIYDALSDFLTHVAKEEMRDLDFPFAHHLHVIYLPQVGCLVSLPVDEVVDVKSGGSEPVLARDDDMTPVFKGNFGIPGGTPLDGTRSIPKQHTASVVQSSVEAIPGLEYQFHTSTQVYCKSQRMRELDEHLGDIHNDIVDYEAQLTQQVAERVLESSAELSVLAAAGAQLDAFVSLAAVAIELDYNRPRVVNTNESDDPDAQALYITKGRHPLQELCLASRGTTGEELVPEFIPNDTAIANAREGAVQLITGPNYSGKSVYLKQVGLIVLMAHCGSFVPAETAEIALTDRISTRIRSRESVSVSQSSFMIDCVQLNAALRSCTRRSLVLVDEFGKGTNAKDGAALFAAAVANLLRRGNDCPKAIFTTHFLEAIPLLRQALEEGEDLVQSGSNDFLPTDPQENLQLRMMECLEDASDSVVFLYTLSPGVATASYGTLCARRNGVPEEIVDRAVLLSELIATGEPVTAFDLHPDESAKHREHVQNVLKELAALDTTNDYSVLQFLNDTMQFAPVVNRKSVEVNDLDEVSPVTDSAQANDTVMKKGKNQDSDDDDSLEL